MIRLPRSKAVLVIVVAGHGLAWPVGGSALVMVAVGAGVVLLQWNAT